MKLENIKHLRLMHKFIFLTFIILILVLSGRKPSNFHFFNSVVAQETFSVNERKVPEISEKIGERLSRIMSVLTVPADPAVSNRPDIDLALIELNTLKQDCKQCNAHELSQLHRLYGMIYMGEKNWDGVISAYSTILGLSPNIPVKMELESLAFLGKAFESQEKYQKSLYYYTKLTELIGVENPSYFYILSRVEYDNGKKISALRHVNKAISMARDNKMAVPNYSQEFRKEVFSDLVKEKGMKTVAKDFANGVKDSDYFAVYKSTPPYPEKAMEDKLSGTCTVEYDVTKKGKTKKVNIHKCSHQEFEAVSIETAKSFLYMPQFKNGKPVTVKGVRNRFTFSLQ